MRAPSEGACRVTHYYSDPSRENDPHALPDLEVFYAVAGEVHGPNDDGEESEAGWYWWACFPGCVPDSDAYGPFKTEAEALEDAREGIES
jgi:hypothetical protein